MIRFPEASYRIPQQVKVGAYLPTLPNPGKALAAVLPDIAPPNQTAVRIILD